MLAHLLRSCIQQLVLLLCLVAIASTFETQVWTYNASMWWDGAVLVDREHGPAIAEIAQQLTQLTYSIAEVAKLACLREEAAPEDGSHGTQCPVNGLCEIPLVAEGMLYHTSLFQKDAKRAVQMLEAPELRRIGLQLLATVANLAEAVPTCEELGQALARQEMCAPVIFEIVWCTRGVSDLARATMAELHAAQVGLVSEQRREVLGQIVPPASSAAFDASRGFGRAEILESLLREALERRRRQQAGSGEQLQGGGATAVSVRAAEVGVHDGQTSEALLTALPSLEMLLVDPFEFADDGYFAEHTLYSNRTLAKAASERLWQRLEPFRNRSVIVVQRSPGAASWAADESLDLVFIDSFHAYDALREDMRAWLPKLRRWGVLAGHDYSLFWPGVCRAVHEFSRDNGVPLMLGAESVWWFHV